MTICNLFEDSKRNSNLPKQLVMKRHRLHNIQFPGNYWTFANPFLILEDFELIFLFCRIFV